MCDYKSARTDTLLAHKRTHTGERPFSVIFQIVFSIMFYSFKLIFKHKQCDQCEYKSARKDNLTIHKRTHTGERPYHVN